MGAYMHIIEDISSIGTEFSQKTINKTVRI